MYDKTKKAKINLTNTAKKSCAKHNVAEVKWRTPPAL